jgi:hypothetical protein
MTYPQGLDQLFMAPFSGGFASEQFNQARQDDITTRNKSLQDMMIAEQKLPLEMEGMRAGNRQTNALAGQAELKTKFDTETYEPRVKAELQKYATEVDENQLKSTMARLEGDLMSPDPVKRKQATDLYKLSGALLRMREEAGVKHSNAMSLQGLQNKGALDVANVNATSRVEAVKARGPAGGKGFDPKNPAHLYSQYIHLANTTEDPAEAAKYNQLANDQLKVMVEIETLKAQASKAGDPNLEAMRRPVPTRGTPQVSPVPNRMTAPKISEMANEVPTETMPQAGDADTFKKAFGAYEPQKFDYRIGPNGKPQRKPKAGQ